jgi:hypothetical protein
MGVVKWSKSRRKGGKGDENYVYKINSVAKRAQWIGKKGKMFVPTTRY